MVATYQQSSDSSVWLLHYALSKAIGASDSHEGETTGLMDRNKIERIAQEKS